MLQLNTNRELVCQHFAEKTGKCLTLKDIHNCVKKPGRYIDGVSEVQSLVNHLKRYPGLRTEYVIGDDGILNGLFFQDKYMSNCFELFQEVLVDATTKRNELWMPLYAFTVIDYNGKNQAVATFLAISEEATHHQNGPVI